MQRRYRSLILEIDKPAYPVSPILRANSPPRDWRSLTDVTSPFPIFEEGFARRFSDNFLGTKKGAGPLSYTGVCE